MMAVSDAGKRYPQQFRIVCSAGEPLNPEAIRWFREQYGLTVLDFYGLTESYPLCANYPFMEVREGSMGRPMPGWDVQILDEDERPVREGRTRRDLPAGAVQSALPPRLLESPGGNRGDVRGRVVPHEGRRGAGRGRLLLVCRPRGRRDHLRGLPDRAVRGRVGLHRASGRPRGGSRRLTGRAARKRGEGVHRPRQGARGLGRPRQGHPALRSRAPLRLRLSPARRVRRRSPEDAHRQDSPDRAARARGLA